jgi:hypothetical protein
VPFLATISGSVRTGIALLFAKRRSLFEGDRLQLAPLSVFPPRARVARDALSSSDLTWSLVGSVFMEARVPAKLSVNRTSPFQSKTGTAMDT